MQDCFHTFTNNAALSFSFVPCLTELESPLWLFNNIPFLHIKFNVMFCTTSFVSGQFISKHKIVLSPFLPPPEFAHPIYL